MILTAMGLLGLLGLLGPRREPEDHAWEVNVYRPWSIACARCERPVGDHRGRARSLLRWLLREVR